MPRRNRIHYRNAFYHVMLRGNNRQNIFHEIDDYEYFLRCVEKIADLYAAKIHLYCLMTNHIHLVIQVLDVPISKVMQSLCAQYVGRHNARYSTIGHLFQGRFKSKLIHDNEYLLELCYYIHMNPVKAKICQFAKDYFWSSHHIYAQPHKDSKFVNRNHIYEVLAQSNSTYPQFMDHKNIDSTYCAFDEDGVLIIKNSGILKEQSKPSLALENIPLSKITKIVCDFLDVPTSDLSSGSQARKVTFARSMIAYFSHYHAKYTLNEIAAYFCMVSKSVSQTLHSYLKRAKSDEKIRRVMDMLESKLSMSDPRS